MRRSSSSARRTSGAARRPGGFDCSGLVSWAYAQAGLGGLPHFTGALWNSGTHISESELAPGDLVFFHGLGHVGVYIGGGNFVHAPHTGDVVKISKHGASGSALEQRVGFGGGGGATGRRARHQGSRGADARGGGRGGPPLRPGPRLSARRDRRASSRSHRGGGAVSRGRGPEHGARARMPESSATPGRASGPPRIGRCRIAAASAAPRRWAATPAQPTSPGRGPPPAPRRAQNRAGTGGDQRHERRDKTAPGGAAARGGHRPRRPARPPTAYTATQVARGTALRAWRDAGAGAAGVPPVGPPRRERRGISGMSGAARAALAGRRTATQRERRRAGDEQGGPQGNGLQEAADLVARLLDAAHDALGGELAQHLERPLRARHGGHRVRDQRVPGYRLVHCACQRRELWGPTRL